jgi:hypothetical protein
MTSTLPFSVSAESAGWYFSADCVCSSLLCLPSVQVSRLLYHDWLIGGLSRTRFDNRLTEGTASIERSNATLVHLPLKILTGETPDTSPCHPNHISKRFLRLETTILDARGPSTWYPLHGISTYHSALSMRLLCLYHWCSRYLSPFTVYSPSGGA